MDIRILVDSAADYEPHELKIRELDCVPAALYAAPSQQTEPELTEIYRSYFMQAKSQSAAVLCITLSDALGHNYKSAVAASRMAGYDAVYIVDSQTFSAGIQVLADCAVQKRRQNQGADAFLLTEQIWQLLERLKHRVRLLMTLDTPQPLQTRQAFSAATVMVGSLIKIKPTLSLTPNGRACIVAKSFGWKHSLQKMLVFLTRHKADEDFPLTFLYTCHPERCRLLAEEFKKHGADITGYRLCHISQPMGVHRATAVYGISYVERENSPQQESSPAGQ